MLTFPLSVFFFYIFYFCSRAGAFQPVRESFFVCPKQCRQPVSQSIMPIVIVTHTHTHTRRTLSRTNREVSLEEAAALAAVTALLKSETLVPVNSNLALRRPLSHSVPPPPKPLLPQPLPPSKDMHADV